MLDCSGPLEIGEADVRLKETPETGAGEIVN